MGKLAPTMDEPFPMPEATVRFLGGPLCGKELAPPDSVDMLTMVWPDWISPDVEEGAGKYLRYLPDEPPGWVHVVPATDQFNQLYVWEPYYLTEAGS